MKQTYPIDVRDRRFGVLFEIFPDRLSVFTIDIALLRRKENQYKIFIRFIVTLKLANTYLLGDRESHSIVELTELKNLIVSPRLLSLKLHRQTYQSHATFPLQSTITHECLPGCKGNQ